MTTRERIAPLFPGYLFVEINDQWWSVRWTAGVVRVLMINDQPAKVPDRMLDMIRSQERGGVVRLEPKSKPRGLLRGDVVRVLRGSFEGRIGVYQGHSGAQRSRILLNLLGRQVNALVRAQDVARFG